MIAISGVVAAAGTALFGVAQANAADPNDLGTAPSGVENVASPAASPGGGVKEIKVLAGESHMSFDVIVQDKESQCVDNPDPGATGAVDLGKSVVAGDTVTVKANLLDCSFNVSSEDTSKTVTVPDDNTTDVVLDLR